MLRAVTHKVLGRGRERLLPEQVMRARVLLTQRTGADVGRSAASQRHASAEVPVAVPMQPNCLLAQMS
jgi:hypothetical protein